MIAVSSSGKSFKALAAYLLKGRTGEELDRVAWSSGRNVPTDDPELAATFMRATASRSDRVEKPVYHLVLSFDPGDAVDRATIERVADRVLDRLGLGEHQAVIVAHRDRGHSH
ncbi:MAG: relaxase/mobilization nuclease domain-containing protein, partial [Gemmatimonadota bacterium]